MTCISVLPEKFLLYVSASADPALRQEEEEEETTSRDSHPVWNVKETVKRTGRKVKTQMPPNGYLVTKPSPVRPHGWEHEEGNISRLPVLPPTPSPALPSSSSQ